MMATGDPRRSCPTPSLREVGDLRAADCGRGRWGRRREEIGDFFPFFSSAHDGPWEVRNPICGAHDTLQMLT